MKVSFYRPELFIILLFFSFSVLSQQPEKKGFLRSSVTAEKLKKALTIDELIENFPAGYEVVSYRISIAGKGLKQADWNVDYEKNILNNTFQSVEAGQKIYIEYIEVKKKGGDSKIVHLQPRELMVIE